MAAPRSPRLKQIVYLVGAGATQSEAQHLGATMSLLMRDGEQGEGITTRILRRIGRRSISAFGVGPGADIEKLISLLVATGLDKHFQFAERMRTAYFNELRASLAASKVLDNPSLIKRLLALHNDPEFKTRVETLCGIITTNHDGLLQLASHEVFGELNLGFAFESPDFVQATSDSTPPILQLHGSFTWRFGTPLQVARLRKTSKYSRDTVWIPPTILKESKNYPFNKLSGLAYELLSKQCDVLRVVGASLTQNDWNVLSLIFNAQRHREFARGSVFRIELIMPQQSGEQIKEDCAYLKNITPIGYLTEGKFADYKDKEIPPESDMSNPFGYWLSEKSEYHRMRGELPRKGIRESTDEPAGVTL